jgi:hypothetical protein
LEELFVESLFVEAGYGKPIDTFVDNEQRSGALPYLKKEGEKEDLLIFEDALEDFKSLAHESSLKIETFLLGTIFSSISNIDFVMRLMLMSTI